MGCRHLTHYLEVASTPTNLVSSQRLDIDVVESKQDRLFNTSIDKGPLFQASDDCKNREGPSNQTLCMSHRYRHANAVLEADLDRAKVRYIPLLEHQQMYQV